MARFAGMTHSLLRFVAGLLFMVHGGMKLFGWLGGMGGHCVFALPPTIGVGAALLLLSAGWWMHLALAGAALLLLDLPTGPWTPGVAMLAVVWLPFNAVLLVKSMLPRGRSDGAQVLAVWRQVRAQRVRRPG